MGRARKIIFIGGPACGRQVEAHKPSGEYVFKGEHAYTVVDEGGMLLRAWYDGVLTEVPNVDSY